VTDLHPTVEAQRAAAHDGVLLLAPPLVDLEPLRVRGKDRVTWLNGMVTSDVAKLPSGSAQFSVHVGKTGKIVVELWIAHDEGELVVGVPRGRADALQAALDRYLIMEQAEIVAREPDASFALALGPRSAELVEAARVAGLRGGAGARRGGLAVGVVFGEGALVQAFMTRAAEASRAGAVLATPEGWERVRIEHCIGTFGVDFDDAAYPQEAALEADAVSFSKGCYLGQEAVFMMQERGHPPRRLVVLDVAHGAPIAPGAVVSVEGAEVGRITSVVASAGGDRSRALALLKWKYARGGTTVRVLDRDATIGEGRA